MDSSGKALFFSRLLAAGRQDHRALFADAMHQHDWFAQLKKAALLSLARDAGKTLLRQPSPLVLFDQEL
jgi:hypothetical protein